MNKRKKIGIITGEINRISETFISRHINHLNAGNNAVIFIKGESDESMTIPYHKIAQPWWDEFPRLIQKPIKFMQALKEGYHHVPSKSERQKLENFLIESEVEVILAEFGHLGCIVSPTAKKLGIPIYTYFRGYDASKKLSKWNVRHAYRKWIPQMDGIFSVSPHLLNNLRDIGVTWKQAHVIPSGVDTEIFVPKDKKRKKLVSIGRFVPKKSPHLTIKAFSKVLTIHPNAELVMIGEGQLLESSKQLSKNLKIEDKITFLGAQPHHVIRDHLSTASIFTLHSVTTKEGDTEGFPSAIQEALSAGAAVVATNHGGIPHFIKNGKDGLLVDEYDIDSYVTAIDKLLADDDLLRNIVTSGREKAVRELDYRILYQKLEGVLTELNEIN